MRQRDLPTGLLARVQRSGRTFFYFRANPMEKEIPLGCDRAAALAHYQSIQRERLISAHPGGLRALDLVSQFQRCNTLPVERHGKSRRNNELKVLVDFFSEFGNPNITSLPSQRQFESWVTRKDDIRNFDSVRLFRMIWSFFTKHGYIDSECPWKSTGQHRERVTLELADILYPYSLSPLKEIFEALLTPNCEMSSVVMPDGKAALAMVRDALRTSKEAARNALAESFRSDLVPALLDLGYETLFAVLSSPTRIKNLPPGKLILLEHKRTVIATLRQKATRDEPILTH